MINNQALRKRSAIGLSNSGYNFLDYIRICGYSYFYMTDIKDILFAFSEEVRLRIILLLKNSILCVNCLTEALDLPQPTISRHLALLRRTGVAEITKDKLHCYYTLNRKDPFSLLKKGLFKTFYGSLKNTEPFKGDFKRLKAVEKNCNANCKVRI